MLKIENVLIELELEPINFGRKLLISFGLTRADRIIKIGFLTLWATLQVLIQIVASSLTLLTEAAVATELT